MGKKDAWQEVRVGMIFQKDQILEPRMTSALLLRQKSPVGLVLEL